MTRFLSLLAAAVLLVAPAFAAPTRADAEKDPILRAMLAELDRSQASLQLKDFQKPFYIEFRILDVDHFEARAAFGAGLGAQRSHQRVARVTVRVGDYKTDSSGGRGDGVVEIASLDADPVALRSALWSAADRAYKSALAAYAQKQAALKQVQTPPQADDFSHQSPVVSLAEPLKLTVDQDAWAARVTRSTGLYRADPALARDLRYSSGRFAARVTTTWLVNSEGSILRKSQSSFQQSIAVGTQAADGMRLDRSYASTGVTLADLDSEPGFATHATGLLRSLQELRQAPLVEEEYHGPVLFSADAGADVMESLVAGTVTATRPRLGTEARTNGPFASSLHARVLPDFLDVVDDPGLKTWNGKGLSGAYEIDDEAVLAQPVNLVAAGRLENYLLGRQPVRDFPASNGHGRAALTGAPRPAIGVLKVTAKEGLSTEDLNKRLLDMAKDRGLKGVYLVETMGGELHPRLLYRLSTDGKRELVRGAALGDLDHRALRSSIAAAGRDLYVANLSLDETPATVLAPALLFEDLTVKRANEKNDKLPFYPPPD